MPADLTRGGQFALIPAKVLYDDQLPATAKLLYGEIYRLSHANGYCYASNKDFMAICQCSEPTVTRLINKLKDAGHIRVKMVRRYGGTGDIVQRRIFCGLDLAPEDPPEDDAGGPIKNDDTSPQKRLDGPLKNDDLTIKKKYIKETPIVPKGKCVHSVPPEVCDRILEYAPEDRDLQQAILDLLENRRVANHKPVKTLQAINGILKKLDKLSRGDRAVKLALLEKAIVSNWMTVFPLKEDELPGTPEETDGEQEGIDGI